MCGFAGQVNLEGLLRDREQRLTHLRAMGQQLARRGPDDEQFYDDGYLSLVYRRLSIIDLEGGQQPLWNEDRSVLAVVNGEIYNHREIRSQLKDHHRFSTQSDSEVVVHLYEDRGPQLMQALNGMFALLAWDTKKRHLLLARDRLGIKPLFYTIVGKTLFFASELKALLAHPDCPRDIDWWAFEGGSADESRLPTFIKEVQQLPGGHGMEWGSGKPNIPVPYWQLSDSFPANPEAGTYKAEDYISQYGDLLRDSVHKRLMSDVPVGLFLSGGLDSTLLAAMAADAKQELHCFTVVEDSALEQGDVEQAKRATEKLGLHYYPVRYDAKTVLDQLDFDLAQFEFLIWAVETPRFDIEWLLKHELHRFAKTKMPQLKVILLGQGADEFAGGYSRSVKSTNPSWQAYISRFGSDQLETRRF
jgi:asparagine synthase (glutamine-hydrolysing)